MSQQMRNGYGFDLAVPAGQSMAVSSITGTYSATIVAGPGKGTALATDSTGGGTYGPYSGGVVIRLSAGAASLIDYDIATTPALTYAGVAREGYDASGNVTSLVDGAGIPLNTLGFSAATQIPEVIFDQSKGGKYLFTQYDGVYGSYLSALSIGSGSLSSLTKTSLQAVTNVSSLKDTAGAAITSGDIVCAWWLSETRFLFVGRKFGAQTYFLWLCNYNGSAWTVGSNSTAFDNGNAVLALGLYSGGQAADSKVLHARSLAVKSSTEAVIGEYNVAGGRVAGAANDAVRVYRTTDGGATWTAILTFNTGGATLVRHCHAVRYDRYTGDWYMVFGDDPYSAVVRWDGSSASPAANSALTTAGVGAAPGWEVLHDAAGLECRSGDITIHPQTAYYMADNSEVNTPIEYAFQVGKARPMLRVQSPRFQRTTGRPPLIQCEMPNGAAFWASMHESTDIGAAPESWVGYDFWYTPDGLVFTKIAKTRDLNTAAANLMQMMVTNEGAIVIAANRGVKLLPSASNTGIGSLVVTPVAWDGSVRTLQGSA